ncbi:MAG: class I SAM-dependent methyltransferase, partial [bacterium]|nr:class I SAM-dependent methyltransferase [bacterium]
MSCIICNNDHTEKLYDILLKCSNCGYIWANPDISKKQLSNLYNDNYFFGGEYVDYLQEKQVLQKNFQRNLKIISKFITSGRLLEIGCAYGFFLDLARKQYQVQGIDINDNACKYAREKLCLDVTCGDFLEIDFKNNYYDVIVMWATLEHLKSPQIYIEKITTLLKPNGIFAFSTLDIDSLLPKIRKNK